MPLRRLLLLLGALALLVGGTLPAAESPAPAPAALRVVMDDNYPPFVFRNAQGEVQGILVDQWRLWERKTGQRVELHAMAWEQALQRMRAGEFDVIDTIFTNPERRAWLDFLPPYQTIEVPIFFAREIAGISDARSLQGFTVGVKAGDAAIDVLQAAGIDTLRRYESYEQILRAAGERKLSVFVVDQPPALYYLYKFGLAEQFRHTKPLNVGAFHRAVAKGNVAVRQIVERGFAQMTADERRAIEEKWYGQNDFGVRSLRWFVPIVGGGVLLVLGLFAWNALLRRAVQKRMAQLQASEERFQSIFNSVSDAIFIHEHKTGRLLEVNEGMSTMYRTTRAEAVRVPLSAYHTGESPYGEKEAAEFLRRAAAGETPTFTWHCRRLDGTTFWGEVSLRLARVGGEEVIIAVVRDITARREAEEQLRRTEEQFRQAQKMQAIGQLAGGVAHDFNNIMAAVLLHIGLLRCDPALDAGTREALQQLEEEVQRGASLTRQLLAYSRQQMMEKKVLDLNHVLQGLCDMLRRLLGETIQMQLQLTPGLPSVTGDAGMLEQVVVNLAVNARDAMPRGGRLVLRTEVCDLTEETVATHPEARVGRFVCLRVTDDGCGMDPATLAHLFEPFFTTKDVGQGAGLGLATVYGIVTQHRGWVRVESAPGQGSTFFVYLPASGAPAAAPTAAPERAALPQGQNETILLVEDDAAVRNVVGQGLRRHGYRVIEATNGPEALRLWEKLSEEIDLLCTDMVMPEGYSGLDLAKIFRAAKPTLRVIVCTGYSQEIVAQAPDPAHPFVVLQKPLDWPALLTAVRAQLDAAK